MTSPSLIPNESLPSASHDITFATHLRQLPPAAQPISTLTPLSPHLPPIAALSSSRKTHVMSILNLTPDSFSDGGTHSTTDMPTLTQTIRHHLAAGATILDIGGQSTRPGAPQVSASEELSRIQPALHLLRSIPEASRAAVSVDTYRASVAAAAVRAGAHMVNDVSGGALDPAMLPAVAALGCTVCLMHMRGTPATMARLTDYGPDGVVAGVGRELRARVAAAERAGVRRWRILLDPGIGFAKTQAQNLELLRRLGELRELDGLRGIPWLVGASRKAFVGRITGVAEPRERVWGTAAAVAAAVQGGADVVRVHDVEEMGLVVRMADAIWRV